MPNFIPQVVAFIADIAFQVAEGVDLALSYVGLELTPGAYAAVASATSLTIYAGLSLPLQPKLTRPEQGLLSLKQSVPPRRRGFGLYRAGGAYALWTARDDFAYDIVMVHAGEINAFRTFYLNDLEVTLVGDVVQTGADGRYTSPQVRIQSRLGAVPETPYSIPALSYWDSSHRLDGIASIFLSCQNGKAVHFNHDFPNGEPAVSAVIEAQKVFDPRNVDHDEGDPTTWDFTAGENPVCQLMTFLMRERGYCYDWTADEVDTFNAANWARRFGNTIAFWAAAADVCDEAVDLAAGGTEPKYRAGGQYTLDQAEADIINVMLTSFDGWLATDGQGGFIIQAGKFSAPSVILTDADIKAISCDRGVADENEVNEVDVTFSDPSNAYNTSEPDPWIDEAAIARAGKPKPEQLDLPWVHSHTQARRLAKRRMDRHQAVARGSMTVDLDAGVLGERYLQIAMNSGPAVLADLIVEVTGNLTIDLGNWTVSFDYIAVNPDARDGWTPETDEGATPPPGVDTGGEPLTTPTIDTISASYGVDPTPRLTLNVTGPDRADLSWEVRWRLDGTTIWQPTEFPDDGDVHPSPVLQTGFVPADVLLEVQTRYQTGGGLFSDWSASSFVDTSSAYPTADSTTITADSTVVTADAEP